MRVPCIGGDGDERPLVERAQAGDQRAFAVLVGRYMDRVYRAAYRFVRNPEDALDVAQDVFVRAWRNFHRFDPARPIFPWLFQIARNLSLNRIERRRRTGVSLPDFDALPARGDGPEDAAVVRDVSGRIRTAVSRLPEQHRVVIEMHHFQGCSYAEIAGALSIPIGTVMSRLYHARRRLRRALEQEE